MTPDSDLQNKNRINELETEYPAIKLLVHPYRLVIVGKSQSGKTTLGIKCAEYLIPQVDEVYVVSPTFEFQHTWDPIRESVTLAHDSPAVVFDTLKTTFTNSIGHEDHNMGERVEIKRLLILDDVSYDKTLNQGNKGAFNSFAYNAVHWNLSILCIIHKTTNIGAGLKENCDGLVLFNTVNLEEVDKLYESYGIVKSKKQMRALFEQFIWDPIQKSEDAHPFLFVDLKHGGIVYRELKERLQFE